MTTEERYVLDASVIAKFLMREEGWDDIAKLLRRGLLLGRVYTLDLAFKEVANVLWKCHMRGLLRAETVEGLLDELSKLPVEKSSQTWKLLGRALQLSIGARLPVYDTLYIALAEELGAVLVTSDVKQREIAVRVLGRAILI